MTTTTMTTPRGRGRCTHKQAQLRTASYEAGCGEATSLSPADRPTEVRCIKQHNFGDVKMHAQLVSYMTAKIA